MARPSHALLGVLVACTPSCLTATLTRRTLFTEPSGAHTLRAGESDLSDCLDTLGAPLVVREHVDGAVLAWGWARESSWVLNLSVPLEQGSASFAYGRGLEGLSGLVLFFDQNWNLTLARRGNLSEILPSTQERAQLVE